MDGQTDRNIDSQRDGQTDRQLAGTEAGVRCKLQNVIYFLHSYLIPLSLIMVYQNREGCH